MKLMNIVVEFLIQKKRTFHYMVKKLNYWNI
uniref:Uncharacterized protein n=1 Tax=viral metagenome TaxID=1070528 RepID=A0A6C0C3G8_9ZZZZ